LITIIMPKKKSKLRKALSPDSSTVQSDTALDDNDLMDDLFAQLDSEDSTVRGESASVIQEINSNATSPPKKDSKSRFIARQVLIYLLNLALHPCLIDAS
jgi:OTU domain-containing protein 6